MQTTTTTTPTERRRTTNTTCRSPAQQIHNGPSHVHLVAAVSPALVVGGVAVGAAVGAGALPTLLRPAKKARARAAAGTKRMAILPRGRQAPRIIILGSRMEPLWAFMFGGRSAVT